MAVKWSVFTSLVTSIFGFALTQSISKGRICATMKCVLCGKTMESPKDTGVTCRSCETKDGPQKVAYCVTCGSEKVVIGTVYCRKHRGGRP